MGFGFALNFLQVQSESFCFFFFLIFVLFLFFVLILWLGFQFLMEFVFHRELEFLLLGCLICKVNFSLGFSFSGNLSCLFTHLCELVLVRANLCS